MTAVSINPVPWRWRLWSAWRGKRRNKELLARLARYNLELRSPEGILAALGLAWDDLAPLAALAERPEGWLAYALSLEKLPGNYETLTRLGLIQFKRGKIYLTDAGRFVLSLTAG